MKPVGFEFVGFACAGCVPLADTADAWTVDTGDAVGVCRFVADVDDDGGVSWCALCGAFEPVCPVYLEAVEVGTIQQGALF